MLKVITQPSVDVISVPEFINHPRHNIPKTDDEIVKLCAFAAKGCYDSFGEDGRSCEENQEAILEHRHGSVLEHAHISLWIEGITRGLSLELNRHRTFNISQRSTRYVAEEDGAIVLDPYFVKLFFKYKPNWEGSFFVGSDFATGQNLTEKMLLLDHMNTQVRTIQSYRKQVDVLMELNPNGLTGFDLRKWARGKARNCLSHGVETRGTWTNNIRGWRWFIEARSTRHAEPEIRRLSAVILEKLHGVAPLYFNDFYENFEIVDDIPEFVPKYSKV